MEDYALRCPLASKCHESLSIQLKRAREAHKQTMRESSEVVGRLQSEKSVLEFQLKLAKEVDLMDLTESARRKRSGYRVSGSRKGDTCSKCDNLTEIPHYNRTDRKQSFCFINKHRVEAAKGRCPSFNRPEIRKTA